MSKNSLRNVLDKNIENHKRDIKQIAKSSLVEKTDSKQSQNLERWVSMKNSSLSGKNRSLQKTELPHDETFNSRMLMFALGPDLVIKKKAKAETISKPVRLRAMDDHCVITDLSQSTNYERQPSIESITLINRSPEKFNFLSPRYLQRDNNIQHKNDEISSSMDLIPHYIHPRFKTQYEQLLRFRYENIREDDQKEQNLIAGTNLIQHLERRLQKKLKKIGKIGHSPNFTRLQVFGDILNDLISESWMFAPILIRIKSAYDDEVTRILEMPVAQKELLQSEVEQLQKTIYLKAKLAGLQSEVAQLEEAINICTQSEKEGSELLIEEEEKLDQLIKEKAKFDKERKMRYVPKAVEMVPTEAEKLELLKTQCWDYMDDISRIQKETRQKMVPRATIVHLNEGLQDIGIEVEKLKYHKTQLISETDILKRELDDYINEDEMRIGDYRLIETILNSSSPVSFDEYQESSKWSWYIS